MNIQARKDISYKVTITAAATKLDRDILTLPLGITEYLVPEDFLSLSIILLFLVVLLPVNDFKFIHPNRQFMPLA